MSTSSVLPATVTMGVEPIVVKLSAAVAETEVLAARVSVGGTTQTIVAGIVQ